MRRRKAISRSASPVDEREQHCHAHCAFDHIVEAWYISAFTESAIRNLDE